MPELDFDFTGFEEGLKKEPRLNMPKEEDFDLGLFEEKPKPKTPSIKDALVSMNQEMFGELDKRFFGKMPPIERKVYKTAISPVWEGWKTVKDIVVGAKEGKWTLQEGFEDKDITEESLDRNLLEVPSIRKAWTSKGWGDKVKDTLKFGADLVMKSEAPQLDMSKTITDEIDKLTPEGVAALTETSIDLSALGIAQLAPSLFKRFLGLNAAIKQSIKQARAGKIGLAPAEEAVFTTKGGQAAYAKQHGVWEYKKLRAKYGAYKATLAGEKVLPTVEAYASGLPVPKNLIQQYNLNPKQITGLQQGITKGIPQGAVAAYQSLKTEGAVAKPTDTPTNAQKAQAHIIAKQKAMTTPEGKTKPQYRRLAKASTGKKSMNDMTIEEADKFITSLEGISEPTIKAGKIVPPTIPKTTELVTDDFFKQTFKTPTPVKNLTSQSRYAELLGVKKLAEPFEIGKQKLDLEYGQVAHQIDTAYRRLKRPDREKMAKLINTNEEAPSGLSPVETKAFNYFRSLTRDVITRENVVRESLGLEPIKYRKGYFRHIADKMSQEVIDGKYPLPEGLKYWSEQTVGKKVYNPMEMKRKLKDDLLEHFSKDLPYVMKSMAWTGLKEIYLAQPKHLFNKMLGALSKDKAVYKNLSPKEKAIYDAHQTLPASTKKWLIDYVNIVLGGRQTALDQSVNQWVTDSSIKPFLNKILRPFGKHISQKPLTNLITGISRLPIYGVLGGVRPKQMIRNKMQTIQNMALYGPWATLRGFIPTSSYPTLEKLKTDSLFKKSYSGFEDMPIGLMGKVEKLGLAPYQWSAISNVSQAMNTAYHWTAEHIQNPKKKSLGWADPKRTYKEGKDFFYPSEEARLLKEMEYGAHTTQFQYIGMGMPEVFRYKSLSGVTRLQSWWMNHWFVFHREAATRAFTGKVGYDPNLKVTLGDRVNYLKYLIIGGLILNTLGYEKSYLFGTAPTSLPPPAQIMMGLYTYYTNTGGSAWEERKQSEASRQIREAAKTFIPGYLAVKDIAALVSGEKHWTEYLFYKKSAPQKGSSDFETDFDLDINMDFDEISL